MNQPIESLSLTTYEPLPALIAKPKRESNEPMMSEYSGPRVRVHNISAPFMYGEIITNFLHKWIENPEEKIAQVSSVLDGETNYAFFLQSLKNMYRSTSIPWPRRLTKNINRLLTHMPKQPTTSCLLVWYFKGTSGYLSS